MSLRPSDIKELLAPFKILNNKHALSPLYKALELSPDRVRGCSTYGILEVNMNLGIDTTMYVDATTFLAVVDSLPQAEDLDLMNLDGVLAWGCGSAKGKLALLPIENMPVISRRPLPSAVPATPALAAALRLGGLSCDSASLGSIGANGIVLDNRGDDLLVCSTDNITLSSCVAGPFIEGAPDLTTISIDAAALLATCIAKDGLIEIDAHGIYYRDPGTKLLLKLVAPLKHDLWVQIAMFAAAEIVAAIPQDRITSFIKRTAALSESRKNSHVTLHAADGQLALSFAEASAGSDEYYLVEGLKVSEGLEIKLDAAKLARALAHVGEVVLDHAARGAVIFRGAEPDFTYIVAGRT